MACIHPSRHLRFGLPAEPETEQSAAFAALGTDADAEEADAETDAVNDDDQKAPLLLKEGSNGFSAFSIETMQPIEFQVAQAR